MYKVLQPIENGKVTQEYNQNFQHKGKPMYGNGGWIPAWSGHAGIDYSSRVNGVVANIPVRAGFDGYMATKINNRTYGNYVELISNDGTLLLLYGHLSSFEGGNRNVKAGNIIGYTGNTGAYTTAAHLHMGLSHNPRNRNEGINGWIDPTESLCEELSKFDKWMSSERIRIGHPSKIDFADVLDSKGYCKITYSYDEDEMYGEKDGKCFKWKFDDAGNPIRSLR